MPISSTPTLKKNSIFKKIGIVAVSFIALIILILLFFLGAQKYSDWKFKKESAELMRQAEEPYRQDTYGGKTPKETLELFIAAVEKNDFELASKYFVLSKQEEWKIKLTNGNKENLAKWIKLIKSAKNKGSLFEENFQMEVNLGLGNVQNLLIDFVKYPSGVWKIQEI